MNNKIVIKNREPQQITINGGGEVIGITTVLVNGIDVTEGSVAYVIVPTKTSELINDSGFITQETDPTIPYYIKQITLGDINTWNNKQEQLVSGVNIKTVNDNSLLGSGNIDISTTYTAGYGININASNEISNTITSYNDLTDLPTIPTSTSQLINDSDFVTSNELSDVAFSGSYADLSNIPEIPDSTSDLINDSGFITNSVNDLVNYYNKDFLYNILPKVSDSGTIINLSGTYASQLKLDLGSSELTQDSTPTPSSPQDIHTISGSNKVVVCGKNLLNFNNKINASLNIGVGSTGTLIASDTSICTWVQLQNDKSYRFSGDLSSVASNVVRLALTNDTPAVGCNIYRIDNFETNNNFTWTNNTNYKYLLLIFTGTTAVGSDWQLEIGNQATTYEPYTSQEADIDLGDIEYCKIGGYADKFIRESDGTWKLEKNIGKLVLDGSETNWSMYGSSGARKWYLGKAYFTDKNIPTPFTNNIDKSNRFQCSQYISGNWVNYKFGWHTSANAEIFDTDFGESISDWTTWLTSNNVIVYYAYATPTYTQITGTLETQLENIYNNLTSYSEQTNISQINVDLPFTLTATTLKDSSNL